MANASFRLYQSHEDNPVGMSDSRQKLVRLEIPPNLVGKTVLDIGCNEGYFCDVAVQRGAQKVVGIDFDEPRLKYARERYLNPKIEFLFQPWSRLPPGPFDVVLWTSAMHYELDPASVFKNIESVLAPNGLFILECGAIEADTNEMRIVQRHSDTLFYPTMALLRTSLARYFDAREVGFPEAPEGDPVPRYVFHCIPKSVNLVVLSAEASARTFPVVESFRRAGTKQLHMPKFIWSIANAKFHHSELQRTIRDEFSRHSIEDLLLLLDHRNLLDELLDLLLKTVNSDDGIVLLETGVGSTLSARLRKRAQAKCVVWDLTRLA